ncbi:MAG TPA: vanadium-dependent haloperoxidase [Flavisolibacter sp.]|nr:vanadium-dependent haloperoxidase [Flavisolibacter sp.]
MKYIFYCAAIVLLFNACNNERKSDPALLTDVNLLHRNEKQLTEVIIYDVFSPPVSSRIYCYTSLAAYEALRFQDASYKSIAERMNGFGKMPAPEKGKTYNYLLAATKAFFTVAEKVTFSTDTLKKYQDKVYADFKSLLDEGTYLNSLAFGESVGKKILERSTIDNYKQTRGMPKFLGSQETGKWRPTPPDYMDAAEPYWQQIKTLVLDSASQIDCPAPPSFSMEKNSDFLKSVNEVYLISNPLSEEHKEIARYWDDNPFVVEHSGHMMYANKKITPVGHWMGIANIACKKKGANAVETAEVYAVTAAAIFDAIISCWNTKYQYLYIRPITVINESIDSNWQPFLQTPPFPEHPSGHSGISSAAATVLTHYFGDNFSFEDTSDLEYIGMKRNFSSFRQAADEASISRVYGGIHYRTGVEAGALQGKAIGDYVISKLKLKE